MKFKVFILAGVITMNSFSGNHPYLFIKDRDIEDIRILISSDPVAAEIIKRLEKKAEVFLNEGILKRELVGGRLLYTSRKCLDIVKTLGFLYRLKGEEGYLNRALLELKNVAGFEDWNPRHFLDTAEMAYAVGLGYDWFYNVLQQEDRELLTCAIMKKGIEPFLEAYKNKIWWTKCTHNWNQVCNGGIGISALAVKDIFPEESKKVIELAVKNIKRAMERYYPDGGWDEGPSYWEYGTRYTVYFIASCETATGTDYNLTSIEGFDKTGMFPLYFTGPFGHVFNFADCTEYIDDTAFMFWLAHRFNQSVFASYRLEKLKDKKIADVFDIIWYKKDNNSSSAIGLPLVKIFKGINCVFLRSDWSEKAIFVGIKGGNNRANHSHLDLGTFVLDAKGKRWIMDLGKDNYNLPGYWDKSQRWSYYRLSTRGHNTLVINGENQSSGAEARIVYFDSDKAEAKIDLTEAYKKFATYVTREVVLLDSKVIITDTALCDEEVNVSFRFHTQADCVIKNKDEILLLYGGDSVNLMFEASGNFQVKLETLKIDPPCNPLDGVKVISVIFENSKAVKLRTLFKI